MGGGGGNVYVLACGVHLYGGRVDEWEVPAVLHANAYA